MQQTQAEVSTADACSLQILHNAEQLTMLFSASFSAHTRISKCNAKIWILRSAEAQRCEGLVASKQ
jgi:sulfur transfer protein SufE